ncbi:2'-5' RNA ligase family protein [Sediminitomix flava]|uniref:2'-5' RNA ligase n=1 Tax=Sediminitomix flava TaxID=379075 RepID=A0A315ZE33_SEDFL|nr:2'-5' RNA ligase family protein [Sediminitomix flava]PWJ43410.1 2'-5' RNA ligase [Sediminitomix flava]
MPKDLYFIAIVPPQPIYNQLQELTEECAQKYKSYKALNSPPHITLYMPFHFESDMLSKLTDSLTNFAQNQKDFQISLDGFSTFSPRVIFVAIQENTSLSVLQKQLLDHLKEDLEISNKHFATQNFHPHITILFKDLKPEVFHQAWEELKDQKYEANFLTTSFCLLKHENGKWKLINTFHFK